MKLQVDTGCVQEVYRKYKVHPDITILKSMANGYAMSAVVGTSDVMKPLNQLLFPAQTGQML